jgi:NADPH2:quinone reductase
MKAICVDQFGPSEVMKLRQVPDLSAGPGQIVVAVKAAGVNPVDTYIREGWYPIKMNLPYTPGFDAAGVVVQTGQGVTGFQPGDRVFVSGSLTGTYAEQVLCTSEQVFRLPEQISFSQGAALGTPYGTACQALLGRAKAQFGQTVLVHGASGGVGIAAVQLAAAAGLTVFATAGTDKGRRLVRQQGARHVLDHHDAGHFEAVKQLTGGRGVDIILEMLANVNLDGDLDALAPHGTVVVIGSRGRIEIDPRKTMSRDLNILGMSLMNADAKQRTVIYGRIQAGLEAGHLHPVIGQELPLEQAPEAHRQVMEAAHYGKIVLIP